MLICVRSLVVHALCAMPLHSRHCPCWRRAALQCTYAFNTELLAERAALLRALGEDALAAGAEAHLRAVKAHNEAKRRGASTGEVGGIRVRCAVGWREMGGMVELGARTWSGLGAAWMCPTAWQQPVP